MQNHKIKSLPEIENMPYQQFKNAHSLKDYYKIEIAPNNKKFRWTKVLLRAYKNRQSNYLLWYRVAYKLYRSNNRILKSIGKSINKKLIRKHSIEIMLGAEIDIGLNLLHMQGIVITERARIGRNFFIRQNSTIGFSGKKGDGYIVIGNNVTIGANCCVIANKLRIGSNVQIGALSFINKDIPDDTTVANKKEIIMWKTNFKTKHSEHEKNDT